MRHSAASSPMTSWSMESRPNAAGSVLKPRAKVGMETSIAISTFFLRGVMASGAP